MSKTTLLAILACLFLAAPTLAWWGEAHKEEEVIERTVATAADVSINVETTNGGIDIEVWDQNEVNIIATKKARGRDAAEALEVLRETEIKVAEGNGTLSIRTDRPRTGWNGKRGISVSYELRVPRYASVDLGSTNGRIEITGLGGTVRADTTNGGIRLQDIDGSVDATTTNGSIKAYDLGDRLDARTTNGSIYAEVNAGSLSEDMRLITSNGSVELMLSPSVAATIEARVSNGSIRSDLDVDGRITKKTLSGDLNGGGPRIELRTSNGRIRLSEAR
ncbi:MAG: DUF4097 family beta strand repeat-containing protein [Acidobacteriota bacterium]